ncbi:glycosyltransferase family 87 protein [Haloarchaeobius litoreus]|uniref:Glycosyltransferase family 87 protein n=1 Tax=Haloarchaeobius litoreus TaxID=755306 RepID=A0ABD6DE31_9EURY|nr:glycosyltransferase family 87 protein [Haloarchaeobius litoreus]
MDRRTTPRLVLLAAVVVGCIMLGSLALKRPGDLGLDLAVYRSAADAWLSGGALYEVSPARAPEFTFLYPPVAVLLFVPFAVVPGSIALVAFSALNVAAGLTLAWIIVRYLRESGVGLSRVDVALLGAACTVSGYRSASIYFSQVNVFLALALAVGFVALERERVALAGTALALPAFLKLFPVVVGAWLLRRRAWRAVGAAVAVGLGLHLLGAVLFGPELVTTYVEVAVTERTGVDAFAGGLAATETYLTLHRAGSHLVGGGSVARYGFAAAVLLPALAVCYRDVSTPDRRLTAWFATLVAMLLGFPSYQVYIGLLLFPLLALLYLFPAGRARQVFLVGAALSTTVYAGGEFVAAAAAVPAVGGLLAGVLRPVLTLAAPATYGLLCCHAACVTFHLPAVDDGLAG